MGAEEALALGLVSRISAGQLPFEQALEVSRQLAGKSKSAMSATKRLLRQEAAAAVSSRFEQEIDVINRLLLASHS